jgi:AraC-like DNA-binding protein
MGEQGDLPPHPAYLRFTSLSQQRIVFAESESVPVLNFSEPWQRLNLLSLVCRLLNARRRKNKLDAFESDGAKAPVGISKSENCSARCWAAINENVFNAAVACIILADPITFSIEALCERVGAARSTLSRWSERWGGMRVERLSGACRLLIASDLIVDTKITVGEAATRSGFETTAGLRRSLRRVAQISPSELRNALGQQRLSDAILSQIVVRPG